VGVSRDCPNFLSTSLLSQERIKLRTSNFVCTFLVSIGTKTFTNFGKSSRGRLRGLSKLFRAHIYWTHRAVVFAIARLSCLYICPLKHFWAQVAFAGIALTYPIYLPQVYFINCARQVSIYCSPLTYIFIGDGPYLNYRTILNT